MDKYKPVHLTPWTLPPAYAGAHWDGYFEFLTQTRDSDQLTRSNFECGYQALRHFDTVQIVRERHWACGWIEWIAIHEDDTEALKAADAIGQKIDHCGIVDEDAFSELQFNEAAEYWERISVEERISLCKRAGITVFAARRDYLPSDTGALLELISD